MPFIGMGPAAWAAVGRALGVALLAGLFGGKNSVVAVVAREIQRAITHNDLETARALLNDMQWRNQEALTAFLRKYSNELPPEFLDEFREFI